MGRQSVGGGACVMARWHNGQSKPGIMQTTPHDSQGTHSFLTQKISEIRMGSPQTGVPNTGGVDKIGDFQQMTHYNSKTI